MRVRRIDHIGIAVSNLKEAMETYEALGLRVASVEEVPSEEVRMALLPVGETRIELLEPVGEDTVIDRFLRKHGEGIHHVALEVEDLEEACRELARRGLRLVYDTPRPGEAGSRVNFVHPASARGVLIELREGS
ncbi:MAG: methylmalonyl-CoA epimerase [Thermoplasmata archaeon]